jgi:predicted ferric reductase
MDESIAVKGGNRPDAASRSRAQAQRIAIGGLVWGFFLGNIAAIVWIWVANHNLPFRNTGELVSRTGGLTGLLGAYLALIQVLLLARLPWLERLAGFDRLTVWHRWNGHVCLYLVLAHTFLAIWGYSLGNHTSFLDEFWTMVGRGAFPGMVTATIGTLLFVVVVVTSITIVRRNLSYELWYAVHLTAYAGIALAWFHEIPIGGDLALSPNAATYWRVLFFGTIALLAFRVLSPLVNAGRYRLRVAEVTAESPTVTSVRIAGHRLDRLHAQPGQFFLWRFLTRGHWWTAHPFSLSAAPDGRSFRISVKAAGDHTSRMGSIPVGTRVVAEGPFGAFTDAVRRRDKVLLIAGGIGITPVRALAEEMDGDIVIIHRVLSDDQIVFADELARLTAKRGIALHYVVGDHAADEGRDLLSPDHLRKLVPDLAEREVYLCGPPGMIAAIDRNLHQAGVRRHHLHVERFAL